MAGSFDTEFIGVPAEDITEVHNVLESYRRSVMDILAPVTLAESEIDSRVIEIKEDMDRINKNRMAQYGREYNQPKILFVDRKKAIELSESINQRLQRELPSFGKFDANSAFHQIQGNFIVIFTHNFEDSDIDAYDTAWRLRHELSHAGSVNKIRAYGYDLTGYRSGARLNSSKRENGLVVDEGYRAIEDAMFQGENLPFKGTSLGTSIVDLNARFPGVKEKYVQLRSDLVTQGLLPEGKMLMHFLPDIHNIGFYDNYDIYKDLMLTLFQKDIDLFSITEDFVYGDKMIAFAKSINSKYGKGMFQKLMSLQDREDVSALLQEIKKS